MSIQRIERGGRVRYRARVKHHGVEVATRVFDRQKDARAWEQDQNRRLRAGDWIDPRRGKVTLAEVEPEWAEARRALKRKTQAADASAWENHIKARFGRVAVASINEAQISQWLGSLISSGRSPSTASRYLATLRSMLAHCVADGRITINPAAKVKVPTSAHRKRDPKFLTRDQLDDLVDALHTDYADIALVLGMCGLRWGELAGLQVGDITEIPGRGLRLQRAVLSASDKGGLYVDTLKAHRSRTVPLPEVAVEVVDRWAEGKSPGDWLFAAPNGGPLSESNWKRKVEWTRTLKALGHDGLRPHDLRHTCASIWLGAGADPKVVQRVLGHASATMTMDLYGHLIDENLWEAARTVSISGRSSHQLAEDESS